MIDTRDLDLYPVLVLACYAFAAVCMVIGAVVVINWIRNRGKK